VLGFAIAVHDTSSDLFRPERQLRSLGHECHECHEWRFQLIGHAFKVAQWHLQSSAYEAEVPQPLLTDRFPPVRRGFSRHETFTLR
jgi:hypothetical protein